MLAPSNQPLGTFEYEFTDDMATEGALVLFELQSRRVKESIVRQGMPHPAVPLVVASATLLVSMVLVIILVGNSLITWALVGVALMVLLLLFFKAGVNFVPSFAHWYARRYVRHELRKFSHRTIRWTFYDDRFESQSAAIHRTVPWSDIRQVQLLPGFWFLNLKSGPQLTIPKTALTADVQAIIRRKGSEAGALFDDDERFNSPGLQR